MAANGAAFTAINTAVTTTSASYVDVTGAVITEAQLDAAGIAVGQKALVYITTQVGISAGGALINIKARHGTADFSESISQFSATAADFKSVVGFLTVWTRVSGETLTLQWNRSAGTATINFIAMFVLNLSDDLTEGTHWWFAERVTDDPLTTSFLDGAALSLVPIAGHDVAVFSYNLLSHVSLAASAITRIGSTGTVTESVPRGRQEAGGAATQISTMMLQRVFPNLAASTQTFTEQCALSAGTTGTRLHSAMFALDLDKFRNQAFAWTEATISLSATPYATALQTLSLTPDVVSDVWCGSCWSFNLQNAAREAQFRLQLDNVDAPAGQTTAAYNFEQAGDATDEPSFPLTTLVVAMSAAAHTFDLDGSADATAGTPLGQHRSLFAMTLELAAAGAPASLIIPRHPMAHMLVR